ncbi:MAG TPA: hypothetical protein VGM32_01870 [Rhodopila sp.]|jgi:hypothetical protein
MSCTTTPESDPVEAGLPTADIIPFPIRPKPAEPLPEDRLGLALASLNAAMIEQRAAVAAWRQALGELKATTMGLGESLQRYHASLGSLSGSVATVHAKASSLEQWAGGVIAAE